MDNDFGTLALLKGQAHCGIIRLVDISARRQSAACVVALELYKDILEAGAIVTVEPGRVRIRLAAKQEG